MELAGARRAVGLPWGAAGALRRLAWPPVQRVCRARLRRQRKSEDARVRRCESRCALPEALVGAELKLPRALRAVSLPGCTVGALRWLPGCIQRPQKCGRIAHGAEVNRVLERPPGLA